jgi:hypothetical protein
VNQDQFLQRCKHMWHVAPAGAWDSIAARGIRTAEQLIGAADLSDDERSVLLTQPRPTDVTLKVDGVAVVLRDQAPLLKHPDLPSIMEDGLSVAEWVALLNRRVYLFTTPAPMKALLAKYAELHGAQDRISFSPMRLSQVVAGQLELTTTNTGAIARTKGVQKRRGDFLPLSRVPGNVSPKEVTIVGGLDDLSAVTRVERHYPDGTYEVVAR